MLKRNLYLFIIGACGYAIIELLWRSRTHVTMAIAGGISLIFFSLIEKRFSEKNVIFRATLSALTVSFIELCIGIVFNLSYSMKIWDYSDQPLNLFGQVCPLFTVLWGLIFVLVLPIIRLLNRYFDKESYRVI